MNRARGAWFKVSVKTKGPTAESSFLKRTLPCQKLLTLGLTTLQLEYKVGHSKQSIITLFSGYIHR